MKKEVINNIVSSFIGISFILILVGTNGESTEFISTIGLFILVIQAIYLGIRK